jgi:hypothetical protein
MPTPLTKLRKIQRLGSGTIEFASSGECDDHKLIIRHEMANRTSEAVNVEWKGVTKQLMRPESGQGNPWDTCTEYSVTGLLNVALNRPVDTTSTATVRTFEGENNIEGVPIYRVPSEIFKIWLERIIPSFVTAGVRIMVKHRISGSSPGVVLTGEVTPITQPLSRFHYRYTVAGESDIAYLVKWGGFPPGGHALVSKSSEEKVIAEFDASGTVGLRDLFVRMIREDQFNASGAVGSDFTAIFKENDDRISSTLAPMPFPQPPSAEQIRAENLEQMGHAAQGYTSTQETV